MISLSPLILALLFIFFKNYKAADTNLNDSPIIGIMTVPSESPHQYPPDQYSYFDASYVKILESGGARIVPVQYDLEPTDMITLLSQINGMLFTGGAQPILYKNGTLNKFGQSLQRVIDFVFDSNRNGTHFPLWGTCEGYQMITLLISQNYSIMVNVSGGANIQKNLTFSPHAENSLLLKDLSSVVYKKAQKQNLAFFYHHYTPDPNVWTTNENLIGNFTVLGYTWAYNMPRYVALIEGKNMPIFGSQFHPEIINFEWGKDLKDKKVFPSIQLAQHVMGVFVNEARKNFNHFENYDEAKKHLIYNYDPVFLDYGQVYFFKNVNQTNVDDLQELVLDL